MIKKHCRHALITGGCAGLGSAFANQLLDQGWHVTLIDQNQPPADLIKNENIFFMPCDLAERQAVEKFLGLLRTGEKLDLAIFNAGVSATGKFEAIDKKAIEKLIKINTIAPMQLAAGIAGAGRMNNNSHMLFVSSLSHFVGYPGAASYAASKDAIATYAKSIGKPFGKLGISVSCAFPGPLKTAHAERHAPKGADAEKRMEPSKAAKLILKDCLVGKPQIIPDLGNRLFALAGRITPQLTIKMMRRVIYEKLEGEVW